MYEHNVIIIRYTHSREGIRKGKEKYYVKNLKSNYLILCHIFYI